MKRNFNNIVNRVAKEYNTSAQNVLKEMDKSIDEAMRNTKPSIKEFWENFPCKNLKPTSQEVIEYIANLIKNDSAIKPLH